MKLLLKYLLLCSVVFLPQAHLYAQGSENEVSVDQTSPNNSVIPRQSLSDDHSLTTWLKNKIDRLRGKEPAASKYHSEILISLADEWNRQMYQILTHEFLQGEVSKRQVKTVENGIFNSFLHALFFAFNGIYINDANKELLIQERLVVTPKNFDRFLGVFLNNLVLPDFNAIDPELATQWKQSVDQIVQFKVDQVVNPIASDLLETRGEVGKKTLLMTPDGLITALSLEEFQNRIVQWDLLMAKYRLSSHEFRAMLEQQLRAIFPEVSGDFLSYQFIKPLFSFINPSGRVKLTDTLEGGYEQIPEAPNYKEAEVKITEFLSRSGIVVLSQESEIDPYEISKLRKVMMWNRYHMEGGGSRKIFHMNDSYEQFEPLNSYSLFRIKADDNGRPVIVRDESVELFNRMIPNMDASALALSRTNRDYLFLDERRIIPQDQVVMLNPAELIEYVEAVERDVAKSNGYWDFPDIMKFDVKTVDLLIYKIHSEQWNKDKFNTESEYKERAKHATSILIRYLDEADLMWKYIQEGDKSTYGVLSSREAFMWFLYHPEKIKEMETAKLLVYGLGSWEKNRFWNANRIHPERFEKFIWAYRNHDRVYDACHYAAEIGIDVEKYEGTGILGKGLFGYAYSDEFSAVRYQRLDQLGLIDHEKERTYDWHEWRSEPWWKRLFNRSRASTPEMFVQQPQIFNVVEVIQMIDRELAESSYSPEDIRKFLKEIKRNPEKSESWGELTESIDYEQLLKDDPARAEKFIQYSIYIDNHEEIGTFSKFKLVAALRNWMQIEFADEIARYEANKAPEKKSFVAAFKGACDRLIFGTAIAKEPTIVYFKHLIKGKNKAPIDKILEVINSMDDFRTFILAHNEVHPDRPIVNDLSYYSQKQMWDYPGLPQLGAKIKGFVVSKAFPIPENLALERQNKTSFDISQSALEEMPEEKSEIKTAKGSGKSGYLSALGLAPLLAGNSDKPGLLNSLVGWIGREVSVLMDLPNSDRTVYEKSNGDVVTVYKNRSGKPELIKVVNLTGTKVLEIIYTYHPSSVTTEIIRDRTGNVVSRGVFNKDGSLASKIIYQYYANKLGRKTAYNGQDIVVAETDYTYDLDGKIKSKIVYNAAGAILSRVEFEYDISRRVVLRNVYDAKGKITSTIKFKHVEEDNAGSQLIELKDGRKITAADYVRGITKQKQFEPEYITLNRSRTAGYLSMGGLAPLLAGNSDKPGLINSLVKWIGNEVTEIFSTDQIRKQNGDLVTATRNALGQPQTIQVVNTNGKKVLNIAYEYSPERTVEIIRDKSGHIVSKIIYTSHGDIVSKMTYQYYAGKLMIKTSYNGQNIVVAETEYTYDADDKIRSKIVYNVDGKIISRLEFEYDMKRRNILRTQYDGKGKVTDIQTFIPDTEYVSFSEYIARIKKAAEKGIYSFKTPKNIEAPYSVVHDGLIDPEFSGNDYQPFQFRPDDRPKKFNEWTLNDYYLQIEKWNAKYPQFAIESMGSYVQYRGVAELPNRRKFEAACENKWINTDEFFVAEKMLRLQPQYLQTMFKSESVSFEQTLEWVKDEFYRLAGFDEAKPLLKQIETKYEWIRRACVYEILQGKSMPLSLDLAKYVQARVKADAVRPVDHGVLDNLANKMEIEVLQKPYSQTEISKFLHELKSNTNTDRSSDWNSVNEMILHYNARSRFDVRYNLLIQLALHARKQGQTGNSRTEAVLLHWITREYPHLRNNNEFREIFIEALNPTMVAVKRQKATLADEALEQYKGLLKSKPTTPVILENIKDRADLVRFIVAYNRMNPNRAIYTGNAWLQLVISKNFPNSILLSQKVGIMIWADIFKQVKVIEAADLRAKNNAGNESVTVVRNGFDFGAEYVYRNFVLPIISILSKSNPDQNLAILNEGVTIEDQLKASFEHLGTIDLTIKINRNSGTLRELRVRTIQKIIHLIDQLPESQQQEYKTWLKRKSNFVEIQLARAGLYFENQRQLKQEKDNIKIIRSLLREGKPMEEVIPSLEAHRSILNITDRAGETLLLDAVVSGKYTKSEIQLMAEKFGMRFPSVNSLNILSTDILARELTKIGFSASEAQEFANANTNSKNVNVVKNGFDLGLSDPNSTVRKAVRMGWKRAKGAFASWMDSGKSPELVPIRVSAGSSGSVNTVALNIVEGSSQAASGSETEVPKIEVVSASSPANGSAQKPNLTTPESIYRYKFAEQQGWDFPTNRIATAPEMAAYLDIAIQEKHPEFYSKWLAKLATISSKYEQVRVISQFMDLRPKTGFSYEHWFVLHLIRKQVQSSKLPIAPQMIQNLMILAAKDQHWNEVAEWKVIAKEQGIGLYDLTEKQLKEIHRQQVEKKLIAASYEESTEVSKTRAIDWFKNQITQAVQNDPYSLEQLNVYLKEIYADQSKKIAWERLLKTMGLEVSKEIRSMDSPMYHLLQRGLYVHLRSKLLQGLDLNHFLYAMRENVAEKYEGQIRDRKNYDKKIAVTFKKEVFGRNLKDAVSSLSKMTQKIATAYHIIVEPQIRRVLGTKISNKIGMKPQRGSILPHTYEMFDREEQKENVRRALASTLPWNWKIFQTKPYVEPTMLEVQTPKDPAKAYEVHQLELLMYVGHDQGQLKRLNELLDKYTFEQTALRQAFFKALSPIDDGMPLRPKIIETFFAKTNLEKGSLDGVALSHLESEILEIGISEKTFIAAKPYLSEAEIKGIQLFFDAQKGNVDEVRSAVDDAEIDKGYKEFSLRKAVMNNHSEVIALLSTQVELKQVVLEEFNRATDRYWLREKKVKSETVSALSKHVDVAVIQDHLNGDRLHDDLRPILEKIMRSQFVLADGKINIEKLLQRMEKWNSEKYSIALDIIAEHVEFSKKLTSRVMNELFVELSTKQRSILLQEYVVNHFFVLPTWDLKKSIEKLNLDINGPPKEGSIAESIATRRMEVVATHINRSYEKFRFSMNRDGTRGYTGGDGTLNSLIFPFPSIKTIKKAYKVVITFVELHLGINVGMLGSAIDILPVAGSEAKNALIAEISAKMDGKETVTKKLLKQLIEMKGFRASDMTGLAVEALEHDKSDVFKFIAGLEESKFNPNQTRIYDGEAITLVERAIQLELYDQFRILMGLNRLDPKTKTKFAALVKEKNFNKYVSNPTESNLSEITLAYNEALKAKETIVVEKPAVVPVEVKAPVEEVKVVVAKNPNDRSEVLKRSIVEQVMSGTINGDEGIRKLLQDKRATPALINETLIEVASKIESKRTRVNRPFFSIESLATLVQHPNADVELGLKAIAIAFERSNKDYHGPLDQAEDVLEIRLKQEQVAKTIATPASNESKGRIAKWWSQTKNYFARKNIQPSESVSKVIAENVSVPAEIAPAEIAILNEYELVPESIAPEKLVVELVQEAEVKKVVETSVELPAAEDVKTETVAKTPKLKVQAKSAVVQNDSNLQAEIERKNLLHTIATKIRGEKKPVISKLLKSNLIRAQDIESLTELALENNKPHYFNELFQHSLFEPTDKILFLTIQLGQYKPFKAVMKHKRVNQKRYARFKCLLDEERNFDRYSKNLKQETLVAIQKEYQENLSQQKIERGEIVLVEPINKVEVPVRGEAELESTEKSGGGYLYTFIIPPPRELVKIWRAFIGLFRSTQSAPENVVVTAPEVALDTRVHIETLDLYERFIAWNKIILDRTKANYRDGEAYEKTLLALFPELSAEQKTVLRNNYIRQNISFYRDESGWPTAEKFIHEFNVALPVVEDSKERSRVKEAIEHMNSVHDRYVQFVVDGPKEFQVAVAKPEVVKADVISIEKPAEVVVETPVEVVAEPVAVVGEPVERKVVRSVYKNHPDLIKNHREKLRGASLNKILHDELHLKVENLTSDEISFIRNYIASEIVFSTNTGGNTFLHTACEKGYHPKIIQMLADHGFSMNVVNSKGYSPTALWIANYIKTVEAHPERVDAIDQVLRNLNNKGKIVMDAQHIPGRKMLPDFISEKVPVRAHRKHILADLKIPDFKYTNDVIEMIHRNIVLGEFPNYEKVLEHVEKGIDIFDYYYDRHGYEQPLSQLFKLLMIFDKQEEYLGREEKEKTKDLLGKIILTAFDKQAKPDAGLLRADELRLITRLGVGFHADAYVHKGPYVFKHDYALRSEIFYRYVMVNPEILATNAWVLDQFVYLARELETAKFENCLDKILKLSFDKQQTIYNYFSNGETSGRNTYNRTLVNQAVFAEVNVSYLRKMLANGADFAIQNDHYIGHDEEGKPKDAVAVNHHLDVIIRYAFHFKNKENAKKVFKFLLDEVKLLPRHKLKADFIEEFAVAMREYGFTAVETNDIATQIHKQQFPQEEGSEKLLATMQRELEHGYKNGVFRDRVAKETEFAQLVKAAIAKSEARTGGSLAKEHEQEKIREFLEENTTNESKKNVWSEIEKALNIKQLHAGNKGSKERANQFESRSAHAHFTGNPKPGVTYPHKITFEKIQELKKYKEWVLENFPKEITAYNEKMGNPNAFNELLSLSMSKEVMIFGGASTEVATKDPTVRNLKNYKGHLKGTATGQKYMVDGTAVVEPKPLRDAQQPFFQKIINHFMSGYRDGFIVSPKGTGKTVLFAKLVEAFKASETRPVYILEESNLMVKQTYEELSKFTNIPKSSTGRVGGLINELGRPVTVMTYASFAQLTKSGKIKPDANAFVIYDEAHRSLSEMRGKISIMWSIARQFGVTASDKFSELKQVANILHHEIWRLTPAKAIEAGMMAPEKVIGVRFDKVDIAEADMGGNHINKRTLSRLLRRGKVTAPAIQMYKEYLPLTNAPQAIVNCADIQDAEATAEEFRKAGIEAIAVHGGSDEITATPNQREVVDAFRQVKSPYKVMMMVKLGEGLDFEGVGLILNKDPTYSAVNNIQRVLNTRISDRFPKKIGIVLEFIYANSKYKRDDRTRQKLYSEVIEGDERFPGEVSPYEKLKAKFKQIKNRLETYTGKDIVVVETSQLAGFGAEKTDWRLENKKSPVEAARKLKAKVLFYNENNPDSEISVVKSFPQAKFGRKWDLPNIMVVKEILSAASKDMVWLTHPDIDYSKINWLSELRKNPKKAAKLLQSAIKDFNEGKPENEKIKNYATYPKSVRKINLPNEMMASNILTAADKTWSYACQSTETKGYWREQLERNPSKAYDLLKKAWKTHVAENADARATSKYYDKLKDNKLPATYVAREIMDAADKDWNDLFGRKVKFEKVNWAELSEKTPQKAARLLRQKLLALNDGRENKITNTGNYPEVTKDLDIPSLKTAKKVLDAAGKDIAWAVKKPKLSPVMPMGPAMLLNPDGIEWLSYHAYEFGQRLQSKMDALTDHLQVFVERFPARLASIKEWILLAVDGRYVSSDKAALLKERADAGIIPNPEKPSNEERNKMEVVRGVKVIKKDGEYLVEHNGKLWSLMQIKAGFLKHNAKKSSKNKQITGTTSMGEWSADAKVPDRNKVSVLLELNGKDSSWFYKTPLQYDLDAEVKKYVEKNPNRKVIVNQGRLWTANELREGREKYNSSVPDGEKITNIPTWEKFYLEAGLPERSMIKTIAKNDGYTQEWVMGEVEKEYHLESELKKFERDFPGHKPTIVQGKVWTAKTIQDVWTAYNNHPETKEKDKVYRTSSWRKNHGKAKLPNYEISQRVLAQGLGTKIMPTPEPVSLPPLEKQIENYRRLNNDRNPVVFNDRVWTSHDLLFIKKAYNDRVAAEGKLEERIVDWETWIRYFKVAGLPEIVVAEKVMSLEMKTEFFLFGNVRSFTDLIAAIEEHNRVFKDEPSKQLKDFDATWNKNRKLANLDIPDLRVVRIIVQRASKTVAEVFASSKMNETTGAHYEGMPVKANMIERIIQADVGVKLPEAAEPVTVGDVKNKGTGPNVYSSIIPGLPQLVNWAQKKFSGGNSQKPQQEPTNEDMNSTKDLDKYLTDLQIKMATMIEKDNGKLKLSSLKDTKAFETLVQYFQSQRWNMTEVDRDTLRKFVAKQQRQAARGNKLSQSLMSIKLVSELMEVLYKDTTGASFKAEFEEMKNREAATPRWFEEHIVDKLGKYQNEGRAVMRVSVTAGRESGKFMFALLMNTVIEEFTNPTVGLKEFIHLVHESPHHLLGLATFSLGAGGGSTLSKLIADRVYGASIEGIQYQVQRSLIRGSQAKLTASMTVGLRTYVRGQIGFIVGSILNGYLYDDHNDPMFWDRQIKSIGSFMIASAMVKGSIYSSVKIVEAFRLVRSGTAAASVNPAGLIWQGLILTAEIYVAPIVQAFYEKSEMQAKLEPMMAQPFHEYIAVLSGKTYGTGCNQAEKPQVLVCLQNKMLFSIQQNWQMLTQYELNRKYQEHLAEFAEWEKDDVASKMVASTDNIYQAVKSSMDMVYSPSMTASKALYQTDQKIIALSPWRDISKLGERYRVVIPAMNVNTMQEGTQEYFEELEELNTDYVNDMVSMFKEFNEDMTEDERVRKRYDELTKAKEQETKDINICNAGLEEEKQACKQVAEKTYYENLVSIVNGGSSELTSTQERVWNAKRSSNPFAMMKFFGAKTYGLEKIPSITFGGRASASEMLDLIIQMSQKISALKPTEEAVIQAQKETVELLLMMYQELTVDVWQHIYFTDQTNPYVGQDKIKEVEMVSSYMPYGYDHTSKTLNRKSFTPWMTSTQQKYVMVLPEKKPEKIDDFAFARVMVDQLLQKGIIQIPLARGDEKMQKLYEGLQTYFLLALGHKPSDASALFYLSEHINLADLQKMDRVVEAYKKMGTTSLLSNYECEAVRDQNALSVEERNKRCINSKSISIQIMQQPAVASEAQMASMDSKTKSAHYWRSKFRSPTKLSLTVPYGQMFIHDSTLNTLLSVH